MPGSQLCASNTGKSSYGRLFNSYADTASLSMGRPSRKTVPPTPSPTPSPIAYSNPGSGAACTRHIHGAGNHCRGGAYLCNFYSTAKVF